jgi:hypothetical protein
MLTVLMSLITVMFVALSLVLFVIGATVCLAHYLIFGPRDLPDWISTCRVCGGPRVPPPEHRWQLRHYMRWVLQHTHSLREFTEAAG